MRRAFVAVMISAVVGCGEEDLGRLEPRDGPPLVMPSLPVKGVPAPLPGAHCEIQVDGVGLVDMENDYLPRVVVCENGGANLEALKAQAIAARSVAYYAIETSGGICDSEGCQVYTCNNQPQEIHYQAVEETSGMYLLYNNILTYGFYVAGDNGVSPPSCVGSSGATEGWVTYNEGKTGTDVEQTALGWIHNPGDVGYGQNRGCMSQWGARCLENNNGYDYLGILRFFYGDDIVVTQGAGDCVLEVDPDDDSGPSTADDGGEEGDGGDGPTTTDPSGGGDGLDGDATGSDSGDGFDEEGDGTGGGFDDGDGSQGLPGWRDGGDSGCACRARPEAGRDAWWLALLLAVMRRRRATRNAASTRGSKRRPA
jgi:hypothetical protein